MVLAETIDDSDCGTGGNRHKPLSFLVKNSIHISKANWMSEGIRPGPSYLDLHEQFHQRLAVILCDLNILRCSATAAFETGLTRSFLPHGLGHLIGLQTHDVGAAAFTTITCRSPRR